MAQPNQAKRLTVNGIVQGVGFRPFVYQLAVRHGLKGEVSNTSAGVTIHVEGPAEGLAAFEAELGAQPPPLAHIVEIRSAAAAVRSLPGFSITKSRGGQAMATLISPDVAVCGDCLREMFDPADRRHRYPFINCTNCGPRFTIIDDIPYDRPKTSMRHFRMCAQCQAEYDDPHDRRFHAQPNACPACGPRVALWDAEGRAVCADDPIAAAAELIRRGMILAVKGLGGFHLAVDAASAAAVARLRQRKLREEKPLAVMSPDVEAVGAYARVTDADRGLLESIQRPIVLVPKRQPFPLAEEVAPAQPLGRRHAALHAAAPPAARPRVHGPGHDQRQPERGAHRDRQRGSLPAACRDRRRLSHPQPRHPSAQRRLGGAPGGGRHPLFATLPGLCADAGVPEETAAAGPGRGGRVEKHGLRHQGRPGLCQPAHRRPREPGDLRVLPESARPPAAHPGGHPGAASPTTCTRTISAPASPRSRPAPR